MTDSRKEFEEWCYINWNFWITVRKGDGYENEDVNNMWRGWKGGRQSVAKGERTAFEQAKLQEEVEELRQKLAERDALLKEKDARTVGDIKLAEQLIPHDPDNGVYGDCYRATLATLLGLDTEQVPHFLHDNCDALTFNTRVNEYLAQFGLVYMTFNAWDIPQWKKDAGITIPIYHEIGDDSPRFSGTGHSVVGCDGEVFHDPHPTKLGLPKVTETRTLGFLVQASPNARDKIITELREALAKTLPSEALERALSNAKQAGRDELQKELSDCTDVAWIGKDENGFVELLLTPHHNEHNMVPLILRPLPPQTNKEAIEEGEVK